MDLRAWRAETRLSQYAVGVALGIASGNPASVVERVENGKTKADADLAEAICTLSDGAVTPLDLHRTRLEWLRESGKARTFNQKPADSAPITDRPDTVKQAAVAEAAE